MLYKVTVPGEQQKTPPREKEALYDTTSSFLLLSKMGNIAVSSAAVDPP
jgi:hypothetical protein